ncbi:MAG: hypothetical protein QM526_01055 [Alphaproteobacteria bacterium]|nr:hypothetical protein [Alphaproteobacteria bacterium]
MIAFLLRFALYSIALFIVYRLGFFQFSDMAIALKHIIPAGLLLVLLDAFVLGIIKSITVVINIITFGFLFLIIDIVSVYAVITFLGFPILYSWIVIPAIGIFYKIVQNMLK